MNPGLTRSRRSRIALFLSLLLAATTAFAKGPELPQRIPLDPYGFQGIASRYLLAGGTMLTVDYLDNQHLLVTFGVSKLLARLPDCPPEDNDRVVRAVVIELPSGKELAHTEWRFHDIAQYLWDLGDGHFLLRRRDALTTISPLQNLRSGDSFAEEPFLRFERQIEAINISADHDLLSIATIKRKPREAQAGPAVQQTAAASQPPSSTPVQLPALRRREPEAKPDPDPIEILFLRLTHTYGDSQAPFARDPHDSTSDPFRPSRIVARLDGRIHTNKPINYPLTSDGLLEIKSASSDGVVLDFLTYTGKVMDLGDFATSCSLRPTFISRSEFVAFGCRGSDDLIDLAGFNLHGDFIWQINFTDPQAYPSILSSIPTGRFAFSRTTTLTNVFGSETPSASQLTGQEVRVIQMYNGKQILRVTTSPIQFSGQNYAFSPDGLNLAVIHDIPTAHGEEISHNTAIEIYKLPPLSAKDQAAVNSESALAPEPANAHIHFSLAEIKEALATKPTFTDSIEPAGPAKAMEDMAIPVATPVSAPPPATATAQPAFQREATATATATATTDPEAEPEHRRKPPTLYEPAPPTTPEKPPQ